MRDRASTAVWRYLEDPRLVLTLERDEYLVLAEWARLDAEEVYAERLAAYGPVTVPYAAVRGHVPKDLLRAYREVKQFTVSPDDTIEPAEYVRGRA
jgi:hypothetical protein